MWSYKKELVRKGVHVLSIWFLVAYVLMIVLFRSTHLALLFLVFLLTILLILEYIRLEHSSDLPLLSILWKVRREKEKDTIGADVFFLIGIIICLAVFDFRIAVAAILMTVFGDMVSGLIGPKGRILIPTLNYKSLEGFLAQLGVDFLIGYLFIRHSAEQGLWFLGTASFGTAIWPTIIVMALTATIVETFTSKIDDNLLIPIFAGFNGQISLLILIAFSTL